MVFPSLKNVFIIMSGLNYNFQPTLKKKQPTCSPGGPWEPGFPGMPPGPCYKKVVWHKRDDPSRNKVYTFFKFTEKETLKRYCV